MKVRILNALLWSLSCALFAAMVYAPALWRLFDGA